LRMLPEISQADSLSFKRTGCNVYKWFESKQCCQCKLDANVTNKVKTKVVQK
jgi:hypothetical protein